MLDASDSGNPALPDYYLSINPFVVGNGAVGYQFKTVSYNGGTNVPLTFDNAGKVGIGTTAPLSALTLVGSNTVNPNPGSQVDYAGEDLSFENTQVAKAIGDIKMVQPTGYYVDSGDMVFSTSYGILTEK